jgi:hypothetical protein
MRYQFIPVRKSDIVAAIAADTTPAGAPADDELAQFCRLLALTIHYEAFDELEALKNAYFHFNPRVADNAQRSEAAYAALSTALGAVLQRANFVEVSGEEIERAKRLRGELPVELRSPTDEYREVRIFRRGSHNERFTNSSWLGLRSRTVETEVYDDVVLLATTKRIPPPKSPGPRRRRRPDGAVLLKFFHDIASADLDGLLPDVRVIMNRRDRWTLGLPAIIGGVPIALKLAPTLAVLFLLAGVHWGYAGTVEQDRLKQTLAVMSGIIALGGFAVHQWLKYQSKALRYLVAVKDSIYFRNVNNNGGVFDALVGAAEEQEFKEALLAYRFLLAESSDQPTLDGRVEAWLRRQFSLDIDFEVADGVAKLERYGLLSRDGIRLSVPPLSEALARLDERWDNYFSFRKPAA